MRPLDKLKQIAEKRGYKLVGRDMSNKRGVYVSRAYKGNPENTVILKYAYKKTVKEIGRAGKNLMDKIKKHENIVRVYDVWDKQVLVMEDIEGEDLDYYTEENPLEERVAMDIFHQICKGIDAAHKVGVVHRDISPGNVMVTLEQKVKIIDFGSSGGPKEATTTPPTQGYASPEKMMAGRGKLDEQSDIYSLGAVLYRLLTGASPFDKAFEEEVVEETVNKIKELQAYPEQIPMDGVSEGAKKIILKCMQLNKKDRYNSVETLMADMGALFPHLKGKRKRPKKTKPDSKLEKQIASTYAQIRTDYRREYDTSGDIDEVGKVLQAQQKLHDLCSEYELQNGLIRNIEEADKRVEERYIGDKEAMRNFLKATHVLKGMSDIPREKKVVEWKVREKIRHYKALVDVWWKGIMEQAKRESKKENVLNALELSEKANDLNRLEEDTLTSYVGKTVANKFFQK